jgi:DNA-binding winged helix-turn-helix (wHTH) protein/tetratricopeptide (TPR) repeat protein
MDAPPQIVFQPFRLDLSGARLLRGTKPLRLTPKAFSVLQVLAEQPGRLVSKEELLRSVWAGTHVRDAVLKVCIREIRKTLGDSVRSPRYIETIHRRGYRFIGQVDAAVESTAGGGGPQPAPAGARPAPPRSRPPASRHAGFVGRTPEMLQMQEWLQQAIRGERQVVFVTGEPGIGKTAVVDVFLDRAAADPSIWVARGKCLEQFGAGEPYLPVLEALTRLCREAGGRMLIALLRRHAPTWLVQMPSLISEADRQILQREIIGATSERMLREMAEAIEALTADAPLVLAIDDLHWSDYSTLDLIVSLARRREPARLMLIGTYREAEVIQTHHPLRAAKQELRMRRQCHELPIGYLSEDLVAQYLERRFPGVAPPRGLARAIHRRTDGNPLFMVNVVDYLASRGLIGSGARAGAGGGGAGGEEADDLQAVLGEIDAGVPESLRQMIEKQFDRLSGEEQAILEAASVAGQDFSPIAVAAGVGGDTARAEAACEALAARGQFLRPSGAGRLPDGTITARFVFVHPLYLNVLYQRVPLHRRLRMHQRIAERGIEVYGPRVGEIAAELAVHFEAARDHGGAVRYLLRAAENASRRYANREAIGHLTRAFDLVGRLPESDRLPLQVGILEQCGAVRRAMGDMRGAVEDLEALVRLAREHGRCDVRARALYFLGSAVSWFDRARFEEVEREARELARALRDPLLRAHTEGYAAYWSLLLRGWRRDDARASAEAVREARRRRDRSILSRHTGRCAYFQCLQSDYRRGCRGARDGMRLALEIGDAFEYLLCQFFLAWGLMHLGEWGEMARVVEEGTRMAETNGHRLWATLFRLEMAWLHEQAFDHEAAAGLCERALRAARDARHPHGELVSLVLLGGAHLGLRQPDRARHYFIEAGETAGWSRALMDFSWQMPLAALLSDGWLALGDLERARAGAERVIALAAEPGERTYLALGYRGLARAAAALGDADGAVRAMRAALDAIQGIDAPAAAWRVHLSAADILGAGRGPGASARHRDRAAAVLRRLATSLATAPALRRSFLAAPEVRAALAAREE